MVLEHFGQRVTKSEMPRVLLRFPGASGVRDFLRGSTSSLAHPRDAVTHFTTRAFSDIDEGVAHFGLWLVFETERLELVALEGSEHVFLGVNVAVVADQDFTWVPPQVATSIQDPREWQQFDSVQKVRALCGSNWQEQREEMSLVINQYFEEIDSLRQANIPFPSASWYKTENVERLRLLELAGAKARWSKGPGA